MSDYLTPCARPENDPNDWFIEKDGRQYADDDLLTEEGRYMAWSVEQDRLQRELTAEEKDAAIDAAEEAAIKDALKRRRHAKDKCHTDCYFRTQCLDIALTERPNHGTYGGYYPEELRQITKLRDDRQRRRDEQSQDADVAVGE